MGATSKSIGEVAYKRPLRECGIEELAVHQIMANPSGGILFARNPAGEEKRVARELILDIFSAQNYPGAISLLTMPGLKWNFEGALLNHRTPDAKGTYFHCIENDRSIYHAALMCMPRIREKGSLVRVLEPRSFAERVVSCQSIHGYYFGEVDALMHSNEEQFTGAWLDYTGPLSIKRLEVIKNFFANSVRDVLVITSLKARWNALTSHSITKAGGLSAWILQSIPGAVLHDIEYQDGSPMHQIAIAHPA